MSQLFKLVSSAFPVSHLSEFASSFVPQKLLSKYLQILLVPASSSKSVFHSGQLGCPVADIEYNEKEEIATLCWETILPMGKAILSLVFHGEINEKLKVMVSCL